MTMWIYDYAKDPLLSHEMTMEELVTKIGQPAVFAGTEVDDATQSSLIDFFLLDRLCDKEKRFLWLWRRRLNLYYPIYKEQLEMWEERRAEKWFFDNFKEETTQHDGTFKLDENTKVELMRELERKFADIFSSKTTGTGTSDGTTAHTGDTNSTGTENSEDNGNSKNRSFAFNYPESNYQGGVIPYDMDNNPSVEFINTQADALGKTDNTHSGNTENEGHETADDERHDEYKQSGTTDNTDDSMTNETGNENTTGERGQETETHWTEKVNRQGDNLNALARELIEQIPLTNFFKELTDKLQVCFQSTYLLDELMEGDD